MDARGSVAVRAADDVPFKPRSSAERPVPPPSATTRRPRDCRVFLRRDLFTRLSFRLTRARRRSTSGETIRVAVLFRYSNSVKRGSSWRNAKSRRYARGTGWRAQLNGHLEVGHGGIGFAGKAVERSQSVVDVIGFRGEFARLARLSRASSQRPRFIMATPRW